MRKGRFDEIFFVDLPADHERAAIFAAQLRARQRAADDFDLTALAGASDGFSGAEIEAVVVAALYAAFAAGTTLTTAHLAAEIGSTVPLAVTRAEAVAELRAWARDRAVPAGRAQAA
jgi:SpoVK/Ycf46/Vps4 family AAA+-type ATPase